MVECAMCHLHFPSLKKTSCCNKFKCGFTCANPCDPDNCTSWTCNLETDVDYLSGSSCFGRCLQPDCVHDTDGNLLLTKDLFQDELDHEIQLTKAIAKFTSVYSMHDLTCLEQLLVNEELDISNIYPQMVRIRTKNPFLV